MILKSKKDCFIMGLNSLSGSASKSNFWQYFHVFIKGNWIDLEIIILFLKGLNLLGFPKNVSTWSVYYLGDV